MPPPCGINQTTAQVRLRRSHTRKTMEQVGHRLLPEVLGRRLGASQQPHETHRPAELLAVEHLELLRDAIRALRCTNGPLGCARPLKSPRLAKRFHAESRDRLLNSIISAASP